MLLRDDSLILLLRGKRTSLSGLFYLKAQHSHCAAIKGKPEQVKSPQLHKKRLKVRSPR
jgi:hypothetical protein